MGPGSAPPQESAEIERTALESPPPRGVGLALVLWPVGVWLALRACEVRAAAIGLAVVVVALVVATGGARAIAAPLLAVLALVTLTAVTGSERFLFAQPVFVNVTIAAVFGASLRPNATPLCEQFARRIAELPPGGALHCRQFTWAWCLFAAANACVAAWLAVHGTADQWAAWTGPLSYVGVVMLLATERVLRRVRFGPTPRSAAATIRDRWTKPKGPS